MARLCRPNRARVRVKGQDKAVRIHETMGLARELRPGEREQLALYNEALTLYRSQPWEPARPAFAHWQQRSPRRALYPLYLERIAHFEHQPPPTDRDGTYTFLTK
jgi:adenylate cyclase